MFVHALLVFSTLTEWPVKVFQYELLEETFAKLFLDLPIFNYFPAFFTNPLLGFLIINKSKQCIKIDENKQLYRYLSTTLYVNVRSGNITVNAVALIFYSISKPVQSIKPTTRKSII